MSSVSSAASFWMRTETSTGPPRSSRAATARSKWSRRPSYQTVMPSAYVVTCGVGSGARVGVGAADAGVSVQPTTSAAASARTASARPVMPRPRTGRRRTRRVRTRRDPAARSPTPAKRTGTPSRCSMAKTIPPRDVESSFVRTMPVSPTDSWKATAWARPFWPVVASRTSSVSGRTPGSRRSITRRILASSSIRFDFVCSRPAVSMITRSARRATAASRASKTTAAGIRAGGVRDDVDARPVGPDPELVGGRGPERVRRGEDHAPARGRLAGGQLADRRGLAGAVDANDEDHARPRPVAHQVPARARARGGGPPARRGRPPRRSPPRHAGGRSRPRPSPASRRRHQRSGSPRRRTRPPAGSNRRPGGRAAGT